MAVGAALFNAVAWFDIHLGVVAIPYTNHGFFGDMLVCVVSMCGYVILLPSLIAISTFGLDGNSHKLLSNSIICVINSAFGAAVFGIAVLLWKYIALRTQEYEP